MRLPLLLREETLEEELETEELDELPEEELELLLTLLLLLDEDELLDSSASAREGMSMLPRSRKESERIACLCIERGEMDMQHTP